jgi:hypothetical protein
MNRNHHFTYNRRPDKLCEEFVAVLRQKLPTPARQDVPMVWGQ